MKSIHLLYCIAFICCSCTKTARQSEDFDVVTIDEYENRYNAKGKLESIKITSTQRMYKLRKLLSETVNTSMHTYTYRNDSLYSVRETSGLHTEVTKTTYYKDKSKEIIGIGNNKDTIEYALYRYRDGKEENLDYERIINRVTGEPIIDFTINDNYEVWYFYKNGQRAKTISHDFNTNQTEETYYFSDIPYKEALQTLPESNNKQTIVCYTSHSTNDTLFEKSRINGVVEQVTKKYNDNGKKIEHTYTADGHEYLSIQYKENDMDITVNTSTFMGNSIDSTYTKNGKTRREVRISDETKNWETYDYDLSGNLTKRVSKTKFFHSFE